MEYRIIEKERVRSKKEADVFVGQDVPELEPDVNEACIIVDADTQEPICGYFPLQRETVKGLRRAVLNIKYAGTTRASGVFNKSRSFGMSPRKVMVGREACRPTNLASEQPVEHTYIVQTAYELAEQLRLISPEIYEHDKALLDEVTDDWRMSEDTLWTSGVINKSSTLPYHRDGFNFNTWSAMPVIRRSMAGGHLHFPEYDFTVSCRDGYSVYFCGYQLVHGVTPMAKTRNDGYRYSIVYYALRGMKDCFTYAIETKRGQQKRTEREQVRAEQDQRKER